jgi:hypothetical protein
MAAKPAGAERDLSLDHILKTLPEAGLFHELLLHNENTCKPLQPFHLHRYVFSPESLQQNELDPVIARSAATKQSQSQGGRLLRFARNDMILVVLSFC